MAVKHITTLNVGDHACSFYRDEKNQWYQQWTDTGRMDGPYSTLDSLIESTTGDVKTRLLQALESGGPIASTGRIDED